MEKHADDIPLVEDPWFRRTASTLVIVLTACLVVLLSVAHVYMPPEDRTHTSAYLRWMQTQHLDHYVEAGNFRLHYLHDGSARVLAKGCVGREVIESGGVAVARVGAGVPPGADAGADDSGPDGQ